MTTVNPAAAGYPRQPAVDTGKAASAVAETKASWKTTEFWVYIASVAGVLIASQAVGENANHVDYFRADRAWLYVVLLSIGYMISRGLAKAGSGRRPDGEPTR